MHTLTYSTYRIFRRTKPAAASALTDPTHVVHECKIECPIFQVVWEVTEKPHTHTHTPKRCGTMSFVYRWNKMRLTRSDPSHTHKKKYIHSPPPQHTPPVQPPNRRHSAERFSRCDIFMKVRSCTEYYMACALHSHIIRFNSVSKYAIWPRASIEGATHFRHARADHRRRRDEEVNVHEGMEQKER